MRFDLGFGFERFDAGRTVVHLVDALLLRVKI
jgi:hypothetical protein